MIEENIGVRSEHMVEGDWNDLLVVAEAPGAGARANEGCVVTRIRLAAVVQHSVEGIPKRGHQNFTSCS